MATNPLGVANPLGINMPWIHPLGNDGYGSGFANSEFNATGAQADLQAALTLLKNAGFSSVRLWLNMACYFNWSTAVVEVDSTHYLLWGLNVYNTGTFQLTINGSAIAAQNGNVSTTALATAINNVLGAGAVTVKDNNGGSSNNMTNGPYTLTFTSAPSSVVCNSTGFSAFQNGFLTNLATYLGMMEATGLIALVVLDDSNDTFPFAWLGNATMKASYLNAVTAVCAVLANYSCVGGVELANEPYQVFSPSGTVGATTISNGGTLSPFSVGVNRTQVTTFFTSEYAAIKAVLPNTPVTVGAINATTDIANFGIALGTNTDFVEFHIYTTTSPPLTWNSVAVTPNSSFLNGIPAVVGELGNTGGVSDMDPTYTYSLWQGAIEAGFPLFMFWSFDQAYTRTNGVWVPNGSIPILTAVGVPMSPVLLDDY